MGLFQNLRLRGDGSSDLTLQIPVDPGEDSGPCYTRDGHPPPDGSVTLTRVPGGFWAVLTVDDEGVYYGQGHTDDPGVPRTFSKEG